MEVTYTLLAVLLVVQGVLIALAVLNRHRINELEVESKEQAQTRKQFYKDFEQLRLDIGRVTTALWGGDRGVNGLMAEIKELRQLKHDYPTYKTLVGARFDDFSRALDGQAKVLDGQAKVLDLIAKRQEAMQKWMEERGAHFKFAE